MDFCAVMGWSGGMKVFGLLMDWERPQVLEGAEAYCRDRDIWLDCRWSQRPDWFQEREVERWDGALVHLHTTRKLIDLMQAEDVSVVGLRNDIGVDLSVSNDNSASGELAVRELLEQGCEKVLVREAGNDVSGLDGEFTAAVLGMLDELGMAYEEVACSFWDYSGLLDRLESLRGEKIGFISMHAAFLTEIQFCLLEKGWRLPDELMMVTFDKDAQGIAERAPIPLTAIDPDYWKRGHDGMRVLDQLSRGNVPDEQDVKVRPLGITRRASTGLVVESDRYVLRLVELIERFAHEDVNVGQLIEGVGMSRRGIEVRFRKVMDCSPLEYLTGCRLRKAKELLRVGSLSLEEVAVRSGFGTGPYLSRVFKRLEGVTPRGFRAGLRP